MTTTSPVRLETLRLHVEYSAWASALLVKAAATLAAEEYTRDFGTADKSIAGTLAHVLAADRVWLRRVRGDAPAPFSRPEDQDLAVLTTEWPAVLDAWSAWLAALDSPDRIIEYRDLKGNPYRQPVWQIVLHVVNHGSHHRGQVSGMLRAMGHPPPPVDYDDHLWVRGRAEGSFAISGPVTADALRRHWDYTVWSSDLLVCAASTLSPSEYRRDFGTADRSVAGTLGHILAADRVWLGRVRGDTSGAEVHPEHADQPSLWSEWSTVLEDWAIWLRSFDSPERMVRYVDRFGRDDSQPAWQIVLHVVNHASHHRGQVSGMIRMLGHVPPALDLIRYYRQTS